MSEKVRSQMQDIKDVSVRKMGESAFVKPLRMKFTQNGRKRTWDFVKLHESVAVIVYNTSRNVLIFVRQFRPAVYFNSQKHENVSVDEMSKIDWTSVSPLSGITLELCAGIMDKKDMSEKETARAEILEECGYNVPLDKIEFVTSYRSGVGVSGDKVFLFYAEVDDEMKIGTGGGLVEEGELIEVVEMNIPQIKEYLNQEEVLSPGGFLFAVTWFLHNKAK